MHKYGLCCLVTMITGLVGCATNDDVDTSSATQAVAGTDTLFAGEKLLAGQSISSGTTSLVYQGDNNLVLYRNGTAIWATMAGLNLPTNRFEMQTDCNAVVYAQSGYVWASWTNGRGSSCFARVMEGDWFICSGTSRVFSALGGGNCGSNPPMPTGYVGCFTDDPSRALPVSQGGGFSIQACINRCGSLNYVYAGAQYFGECFCGNTLGYTQVADTECNTPCNSGGGFCGGAWRNSIYSAGGNGNPCGNGVCDPGENCNSCPHDCGICEPPCGNAVCDFRENCNSCPEDCGLCQSAAP